MSREWRISDQICCSKQVDGRVVKKGELAAISAISAISDQICCSKQVDGRAVKKGELAAFHACCLNTRSPSGDKMKQSSGIFYAHHQEYSDAVCPNIIKFAFLNSSFMLEHL